MKTKEISIQDLQKYEQRLAANNKKSSLSIAFSICFKHVKLFRLSLFIALGSAVIATIISILSILGINYLTNALGTYALGTFVDKMKHVNIFGIQVDVKTVFPIIIFCIILLVLYLLLSGFFYVMNYILAKVANDIGYYLRRDLFNKIQLLKLQYFDTNESGDIMSILTNDVFNIVLFIAQNFGTLVYGISSMLGMSVVMFLVSPYLALIAYGIVGIASIYVFYMSTKSGKSFFKQQQKIGKINGYIEEIISAQNIVNLFQREKLTEYNFSSINKSLNKESERAQTVSGLFIPWMNFLANFSLVVIAAIAVVFVWTNTSLGSNIFSNISKNSVDSTLVAISVINMFLIALRTFIQPINNIVGIIAQLQQALAGARRTSEVFIVDEENNKEETIDVPEFKGKISIKNLNFSYVPNKQVLNNINLDVNPGETIAIVGPTGSGKTTIINLLTKFYDIEDGEVIFDDKYRIQEITKKSIRDQVSIVLQDTYLFSDTVKENIKYAKKDATDEEIINVAKISNCDSFIRQLENGYDTQLSENANELSQGQKQLIAIARAMLSKSSILILDEATSNIDTRTEKIVQEAMNRLIAQKTAFVIAHRLSTIKNADKIIVINSGKIIEMGNHEQLIKKKGFYYKLSQSKTGVVDEANL